MNTKPKSIEYELDNWSLNYYSEHGRDEASVTVIASWVAKMPEDIYVPGQGNRTHTIRTSANFKTMTEALSWIRENIKGEKVEQF